MYRSAERIKTAATLFYNSQNNNETLFVPNNDWSLNVDNRKFLTDDYLKHAEPSTFVLHFDQSSESIRLYLEGNRHILAIDTMQGDYPEALVRQYFDTPAFPITPVQWRAFLWTCHYRSEYFW